MTALVQVRGDAVLASSLDVARSFDKLHAHVLRSVVTLLKARPDLQSNFGLQIVSYEAGKGATRQRHHYEMDRKGFTLLAMGFTGPKALEWKIAYIDAFDRMEAALRSAVNDDEVEEPIEDGSTYFEQVRGDELERKLSLMREIRLVYGRDAARKSWNSIGLPPIMDDDVPMLGYDSGVVPHDMIQWLNERTERAPDHRIGTRTLHRDYQRWAMAGDREAMTEGAFGKAMVRAGYPSRRSNTTYRLGLRLLPE